MSTPTSDVLIIGGGVAGLTLALEVADHRSVTLVRPAQDDQGASRWAQGGIAAVLSPDDDLDAHINDTLIAGDGLCDIEAVRFTVTHGPAAIQWLIDKGVPFTPEPDPTARYPYHLTREGGHNARRIIHADDATGRAVVDTLLDSVARHPNITQRNDLTVVGLLQDDQGACRGAYGNDTNHQWHSITARHTVLATGGASGLYRHTTTPAPSSGEGMMMAAELGARLMNLEFQQFHPTCLFDPEGPAFLISEAVRGEGGHLLNEAGERFMLVLDKRAELAPRDVVARAIDAEIQHSSLGHVWLDIRHLGEQAIRHHFPTILAHCATRGIDITQQAIPVVPAAHYSCGGVATNLQGASDVANLYAIGETACTGLHGANRMASNSLLECLVFARSCAQALLTQAPEQHDQTTRCGELQPPGRAAATAVPETVLSDIRQQMRATMSQHVSIVRSATGLTAALANLKALLNSLEELEGALTSPEGKRLHQTLQLAILTVLAALQRHESRGLHYSTDWPHQQPKAAASSLSITDLTQA
ncbi:MULTISPECIES: L-aspartate oxidase [unclassified Halomonas]|uniref:L-aspartate oxidase n=1 Tax=unclassified Halomonas TaxID=2609666 RepID=UPI0007D95AE2|nr:MULTISPECIES: L-aspartate oxidase [unclassified Halomonas]MBT2788798.1 L-aspartate oxidase [Halomonas sp. ISL-106]MBT2799517.1 L-aspartate oxidase [Halomonas sp. ISL-104]OAL60431.1 L-aspartate oxidase [Halomonas sp. ALS9]